MKTKPQMKTKRQGQAEGDILMDRREGGSLPPARPAVWMTPSGDGTFREATPDEERRAFLRLGAAMQGCTAPSAVVDEMIGRMLSQIGHGPERQATR